MYDTRGWLDGVGLDASWQHRGELYTAVRAVCVFDACLSVTSFPRADVLRYATETHVLSQCTNVLLFHCNITAAAAAAAGDDDVVEVICMP